MDPCSAAHANALRRIRGTPASDKLQNQQKPLGEKP
jgi:hypothetical protein